MTAGAPNIYQSVQGTAVPPDTTPFGQWSNVGYRIRFDKGGRICAMRMYHRDDDNGHHTGVITDDVAQSLRSVAFPFIDAFTPGKIGWQTRYFKPWLRVAAATLYRVNLLSHHSSGPQTIGGLNAADIVSGHITAPANISPFHNGWATSVNWYQQDVFMNGSLPAVDVLFYPDGGS